MERKKIVLIDDDETMRFMTGEILALDGYDMASYERPFGATNFVHRERPDLILMDINMPGLSGEGLVELLRRDESTQAIPIVFYSSNDEDSLRHACARHQVDGYVSKGDPDTLLRTVAAVLSRTHTVS